MPLPVIAGIGAFIFGRTLLSVAARILVSLGIGFTVFQGVSLGFSALTNLVYQSFNGLPSTILALIGLSGIDVFISLVLSAYAAALTLKGISGTIKQMRFK